MEKLNSKVDINKEQTGDSSLESLLSQKDDIFHALGSDESLSDKVLASEDENLSTNENNKKTLFVRQRTNTITTIAFGTTVNGEIFCDDDIVVEGVISGDVKARRAEINGKLKGNLECETAELLNSRIEGNIFSKGNVVVGSKSVVIGDIKAKNLTVDGNVKGDIEADGYLHISGDACQVGEVSVKEITIAQGANVIGNINIMMPMIDMSLFDNI